MSFSPNTVFSSPKSAEISELTELSINSPVYINGSAFIDYDKIPEYSIAEYTSNSSKIIINGSTEPNATINGVVGHDGVNYNPFNVNMDKKTGNFIIEVKPAAKTEVIYVRSKVEGKNYTVVKIIIKFPNYKAPPKEPIDSSSSGSSLGMELDDYDKGYEHGYLDGWYGDYYNSYGGEFGVGYQKGYEYGSSDHYQDLIPEFEIYGAYTRWEP